MVREVAEPKKKQEKKGKIPSMVKRFLGTKMKASRELRRKENLSQKQIEKFITKIYRAETAVTNYYQDKQENAEQAAWEKMKQN